MPKNTNLVKSTEEPDPAHTSRVELKAEFLVPLICCVILDKLTSLGPSFPAYKMKLDWQISEVLSYLTLYWLPKPSVGMLVLPFLLGKILFTLQ